MSLSSIVTLKLRMLTVCIMSLLRLSKVWPFARLEMVKASFLYKPKWMEEMYYLECLECKKLIWSQISALMYSPIATTKNNS